MLAKGVDGEVSPQEIANEMITSVPTTPITKISFLIRRTANGLYKRLFKSFQRFVQLQCWRH
jgi:hypothetical protein